MLENVLEDELTSLITTPTGHGTPDYCRCKYGFSHAGSQFFGFKNANVRRMLDRGIPLPNSRILGIRKPPKSSDLGGFLVAEAGLEPTTSGL